MKENLFLQKDLLETKRIKIISILLQYQKMCILINYMIYNRYHRAIKIKAIDVKSKTYINSSKEINGKDSKFKIGNFVRISKYKNIFAKGYFPNWSEELFVIKKIKNTVPWTYLINDFNGEEIVGIYYEKELQKTNHKEFRDEKVIKRKDDKLYVKWNGYNKSFNSWTDKKGTL